MKIDQQASEIIEQYEKHGWTLSRVLLTGSSRAAIGDDRFSDVPIVGSMFDAAWFTRSSIPGTTTWELRTLSGTPFALLEVIEDGTDEASRDDRLKAVERRMAESRTRFTGN